jgi:hypothetical protein
MAEKKQKKLTNKERMIIYPIIFFIFGLIILTWGIIQFSNTYSNQLLSNLGFKEDMYPNSTFIKEFYLLEDEKITVELDDNYQENTNFTIKWLDNNKNFIANGNKFRSPEDGHYYIEIENPYDHSIEVYFSMDSKYFNDDIEMRYSFSYLLLITGISFISISFISTHYLIYKKNQIESKKK